MKAFLDTIRVLGLDRVLRLYRGYRLAWQGPLNGFYNTRIIQTLFNVGFFDEMQREGSVQPDAFALAKDLDPEILRSLCVALYATRFLRQDGDGYCLDRKGRLLVDVTRGWFDAVYGYEGMVHHLEGLLRKEMVYGRDICRRSDFVAAGSGQAENWFYFPFAIDAIRVGRFKNVMDFGCGDAAFLRRLCEGDPEVTGYGLDIAPEAIAKAKTQVRQAGLESRIQLFVGDIDTLEELPQTLHSVDITTVFLVLHELLFDGPDRVVTLLKNYRRLFPGVPLMVFEMTRPTPEEMRRRPGMSVQYVVQHDLSHQRLAAASEWRAIFRLAGFRSVEERHLDFARTVIFTLC